MEEAGRILAISISRHRRIKKTNVPNARLIENFGIEGDAHAGNWTRQVSLMSLVSIQKMVDQGLRVGPGDFAENITTDGIDLLEIPVGTKLFLGEGALIEITQIGKVCHTPCAIYYQVGNCIFPTEGIFARVLSGGEIQVGDRIKITEGAGTREEPVASVASIETGKGLG
ncbi:MAG: MOSC domain-containing protein [Candidatus Omnitrophica bacterium]|nr:MOSC domain-containing protein [Candidatus Omnitrophota bacterium]